MAPESDAAPAPLFVAGIGASAGGLAATSELLRLLGARPGIAVVVVHHLDPAHESSLVDIFSKLTPLHVETASDGRQVEADHVYIVPPNAGLALVDGKLELTPRVEAGGLHLPIDRFFESLARDLTVHALGVVLTGTGSDGSVGVRAIKAAGGVTFAQDSSAEHRGMPESAIETGCIDFVLPPDAIARELIRVAGHRPGGASATDDAPEFQRVLSAMRKSSGIDFVNYKHSTLRRRVQRRIVVNGLANLADYSQLVERSPEETRALCDEVLIHVTSFFRDAEMFDALKEKVFPKLIENRPENAPIRIWVPGCSTGEEVYSIAISLLEFLGDTPKTEIPLKLFGTDVSLGSIDGARAGRYSATIEQDLSPGRLQRFFTKLEGRYQINKDVRDLCIFAKQDATRDPPFAGVDLISCRNLMIYLGSPLQDRLLPIFHYALKESGFLVLGTSETVRSFPGFAPLDAKNRIYARTSAVPRLGFDFTDPRHAEPTPRYLAAAPASALDVQRQADRLVLAEYAPPGVVITDDLAVVQFRGRTGLYLEPTPGAPSLDLLRLVREDLRLPLRQTIDEARRTGVAAHQIGVMTIPSLAPRNVEITVIPYRVASPAQRFFVVLFSDETQCAAAIAAPAAGALDNAENQLRQELTSTHDYLQSVIDQVEASNEELKAANEEIVASNEELRSTNEELQMAKEELQSTNEELGTVNDEMSVRTAETTRLNDDLTNVLSSVEIPILLLGRDSRIRRFTPAAAKLFHLIASDVGRPLSDIRPVVPAGELARMIGEVLERLIPMQRSVQDEEGRWHQLTVRAYVTRDNRIDGTVITAVDVNAMTKAAKLLHEAHQYAESIIETVREGLVVLDADLRVRSANRAFQQMLGASANENVGRHLGELGHGEWKIPDLIKRLEELGEDDNLDGFRVEQTSHDGPKTFVLNARRIAGTRSILLALEDLTEQERAHKAVHELESGFREMLTTLGEAILMSDEEERVVYANQAAASLFGYAEDELLRLQIDALVVPRYSPREAQISTTEGRARRNRALIGRRKDGSELPIEVVVGSMRQDGGPLFMSFITDITRREESEKQLRDYQQRLQRMAHDAVLAEDRERRRIAIDLHDRIGQSLALAQIKLTSTRELVGGAPRDAIDQVIGLLAQSVADTHTLVFDLCPPILYDLGLKEALSWLVEDVEKRHGLEIELIDDGAEKSLDEASATLAFRAVRELVMNVLKHAQSPKAVISLRRAGERLQIEVADQGVGFDESSLHHPDGGFGLFSVREQITNLGGSVEVASVRGQGTRVNLRIPLAGEANRAVEQEEK